MYCPIITELFAPVVAARGAAVAIVEDHHRTTYEQLDALSEQLAQRLRDAGVGPGSLVPIVAHRSAALVVAMLAVLKTGSAYTPIDRDNPSRRRAKIIEQCGAPVVLSTGSPSRESGTVTIEFADGPVFKPLEKGAAYVVFTSGTTGTPKGVVVDQKAVIRLVRWHNDRFDTGADARTTLMSGVGFDVSQWEIHSTLAAGATAHVVDPAVRADPAALLDFYAEHAITHAFVPTVLTPDVVAAPRPADLALRYLFCAGEKLPPIRTGPLPYTLVDYYGPTEATIFATCRVVDPAAEQAPSIGTPISDTEAFILDDELGEVDPGAVGELCLAGTCLARGYLGDRDRTEDRFVWSPRLERRLYRTGDLARWLPDGSIEFLGRSDDQVKIRGYRIELGDIEAAILDNRLVKHAVVVVDDQDRASSAKRLAAFVVPREHDTDPDALVRTLRVHMRDELPDYMQPGIYQCRTDLPVTANGKIDRAGLRADLAQDRDVPMPDAGFEGDIEHAVAEIWREVLGHNRFSATDNFFDVGGHSLLATALIGEISRRVGARVYIWDFYGDPTVRGLAAAINSRGDEAPDWEGEPVRELADDIHLPDGVDYRTGWDERQLTDPSHTLLTGATGIIGVHLLGRLHESTDAVVHCLIRAGSPALARERLRAVVARYEVTAVDWDRVRVHAGDLAEPRFGLDADEYAALASDVDVIYHSASAANFIQSYAYIRRDNVEGLRTVLRFAGDDHVKPLMLVSSISVYSWGHLFTGKSTMYEDDDIDQNLRAVVTDLGYMRSKWVMEKVAELAEAQGLPVMKFRLGYALCDARTGHAATYQWWPRLVKTCVALGAIPDLQNLREGLITVDYIVDAIAAIGRDPGAAGKNFNVVPAQDRIVTLRRFFELLEEHFGYEFRVLPYEQWVDLWKDDPQAPLYPLLNMFHDHMLDRRSTIELYQNTYLWDKTNVTEHLVGTGVEEPTLTPEILDRYLRRVLAEPYVPAAMADAR
ncbi:amino acid adenylation domain-containing protein/thioester reductase-like protein [Nocardia tenerifensis]|uniref:Amino acid adenylation domain-containing protein/thioester reductase-like protein n=1 Tax=Nocardia tenerifensis TaxID=228006 RepID=A0A318KB78_9NOCA|nr:amino acid adenylation domain-containing protein [Nocardia tenerifensis]PXX71771.1 amino acid adenylation domain-containing protein/thioester reductase-like protein [Nocardia tenerifensis]